MIAKNLTNNLKAEITERHCTEQKVTKYNNRRIKSSSKKLYIFLSKNQRHNNCTKTKVLKKIKTCFNFNINFPRTLLEKENRCNLCRF